MASSKEYLEFILGQLSGLNEITYRAMMGEFVIYLNMPLWHALLASFLPSAQTMHESLFTGYFLFHFVLKSS